MRKRNLKIAFGFGLFVFGLICFFFGPVSTMGLAVFPLIPMFRAPDKDGDEGGITQEKLNDALEKMGKKTSEAIAEQIDKATKGKIGMEEFTKTLAEAGIEKGVVAKLEGILKEQGAELAKMKMKGNKKKDSAKSIIHAAFEDTAFIESVKDAIATGAMGKGMSKSAWEVPVTLLLILVVMRCLIC